MIIGLIAIGASATYLIGGYFLLSWLAALSGKAGTGE